MNSKSKIKNNGGQAMLVAVMLFLVTSLSVVIGFVGPITREFKVSGDIFNSKQVYFLSESGVEDAFYRINHPSTMTIGTSTDLTLGSNTTTTNITDLGGGKKNITSSEDVTSNSQINSRKVELIVDTGVGAAFNYGVQVGQGGFSLSNGSGVNGNVYSNGDIVGSNGAFITGTAIVANGAALASDQSNGSGTPPYDINFGNANGTQDFAQSFQVSSNGPVNKVQLYLKKVGSPGNPTVRISPDSSGSPANSSLTTGTLSASLVSTNYPTGGWPEVTFSSNPTLSTGITYWIVIDGSTSSTNYYTIGANNNGYTNGVGKIGAFGSTWNTTTPSGLDGYFNLYLGGLTGTISGVTVGTGTTGDAKAHTVNNSTVRGNLYCQSGTGNNKACNTSQADPTPNAFPISDTNISTWKDDATAGGVFTGNKTISGSQSLGPLKITGNLSVANGAILTMTGTVWVQGTITVSNNGQVKLDSSYGNKSGIMLSDSTVSISNNGTFAGSGTTGSYIMLLTTSSSTNAISVGNNSGTVILNAQNGTINFSNNAGAKEATANMISLSNNAVITYDSGLANISFSSGPSGSWNISSWQER